MSDRATVSVIVVSRHRPEDLDLCLLALSQQRHIGFELVVVCDPVSARMLRDRGWLARVKLVVFDLPNISAARNLGLAAAAGEVVAFIDDDACAEPTWLARLIAPFQDPAVHAATGFVRGRNGISFQSKAVRIDCLGRSHDIAMSATAPATLPPPPGGAIKTVGTNCAFRRRTLAEIGGFDPGYAFYLDEADVNMRLATRGILTTVVPLAQVHHSVSASARRSKTRMPRRLSEIAQSQARFLSRHAPLEKRCMAWREFRHAEFQRLIRHMVIGNCTPGDVGKLMSQVPVSLPKMGRSDLKPLKLENRKFEENWPERSEPSERFLILPVKLWNRRKVLQELARRRADLEPGITVFAFSPSAVFHWVEFLPIGVWIQYGGVWGKSDRSDPLVYRLGFRERAEREWRRVDAVRGFLSN